MTAQENSTLPADEKYKSLADRIKPKGTEDVGSDRVIQQFIEALPSALNFNIETIKGH